MKKLVSILCAFALVFGLAGCGHEKKPEKKVTITIAAAASLEKTFEETLIPRFSSTKLSICLVAALKNTSASNPCSI